MFQVWLVWATNVWKSTLFNRLIGQFRAIVTDIAGTTRDILYHLKSKDLMFADSPWLDDRDAEIPFLDKIVKSSDMILFVIDSKTGFTAKEDKIHSLIIKNNKKDKTILVLNKVDKNPSASDREILFSDYYNLGYNDIVHISAKKWSNIEIIRDLISGWRWINDDVVEDSDTDETVGSDKVVDLETAIVDDTKNIPDEDSSSDEKSEKESTKRANPNGSIQIAIVGRPNSGKSTLMNFIVGKDISKVSEVPGTTLDYVMYDIEYKEHKYTFYDTAWIRKRSKSHGLEAIAYTKTVNMLKYVRPLVLFLIEWTESLTHRDQTLLAEIVKIGLPMVIAMNKSDMLTDIQRKTTLLYIQDHLPQVKYAPIMEISAKTGMWVDRVFAKIQQIQKYIGLLITTHKLNTVVQKRFMLNPPKFPKNKICKIFYLTQLDSDPFVFKIFVNHKSRINFSFKKRIENTIRKEFDLEWFVIKLTFEERKRMWDDAKDDGKIKREHKNRWNIRKPRSN